MPNEGKFLSIPVNYSMETNVVETKWLRIEEGTPKKKTKVFFVFSKCDGTELGQIKWYPSWRHYCFLTSSDDLVFSDRCILSIYEFVKKLNDEHKGANSKRIEFDPTTLMQRFHQYGFSEEDSEKIYEILHSYEYDIGIIDKKPSKYYPNKGGKHARV